MATFHVTVDVGVIYTRNIHFHNGDSLLLLFKPGIHETRIFVLTIPTKEFGLPAEGLVTDASARGVNSQRGQRTRLLSSIECRIDDT